MSKNVVLITGAGSGMGQLAAKRALASGASVAALDVNVRGLDALGESSQLLKLAVDTTDPAAVNVAVVRAENELGPLDRVINSAAIMPLGLLMEQDQNLIHRIMNINYGGLVNVTRAALPGMLARKRGDFISFSSSVGFLPVLYMGAYAASKFAVNAFTEILYHENIRSGVRFACVCPPMVATPLLDQAKSTVWPKLFDSSSPITPEEVLDEIDKALEKEEFWVFPGGTKVSYDFRRFDPDQMWQHVHAAEGR